MDALEFADGPCDHDSEILKGERKDKGRENLRSGLKSECSRLGGIN